MNVGEVGRRVKRSLGDASNIFISDADIFDWVSDGQVEICRETKVVTTSFGWTANSFSAGGVGLPSDFLIGLRVTYADSSTPEVGLKYTSVEELDDILISTEDLQGGQPVYYYYLKRLVHVFPRPAASNTGTIKLYYSVSPPPVTSNSDALLIPIGYHVDLVNYCLMRAYERDQNYQAMNAAEAKFKNNIGIRRDEEEGDDSYLSVRDYDGWEF